MTPTPGGPLAPGGMDLYGHLAPGVGLDRQCPHCHGISQVVPSAELQFACSICGGPRVPFAEGVAPSASTVAALRRAETARKARGGMRALSIAGALGGSFAAVLSLLALFIGGLGWAIALGGLFGAPSLAMMLLGSSRSKAKSVELKRFLDEAWASASGDAYAAGKAPNAAALAQSLNVSLARAEELEAIRTVDASLDRGEGAPLANIPRDPRFDALERKVRIADANRPSAEAEAEAEAEAAQDAAQPTQAKR